MSSPYLSSPLSNGTSLQRTSSRSSVRSNGRVSPAPVLTLQDENVAIRTQMSTLKHNIRHQQAQLHNLENSLLRGPRPLPPGVFNSPPLTALELDGTFPAPSGTSSGSTSPRPSASLKLLRRTSFERALSFGEENGIQEGVPTSSPSKRAHSPSRSLHRIPVSSVGNARALAEQSSDSFLNTSTSSLPPLSPNRRASFTPGNTTKVLADLQAGVLNARNALENTKGQLRLSQRQVSQLTRQTEDLKEVRERLRLENEGLNNVVARKERLLQEVLDRARKAEAEVVTLKSELKSETSTSKKTLRDMETALAESTARSQKAEREYVTLRDSLKGLVESFKADHERLREEMRKREERMRKEAEDVARKYKRLVEEVKREREGGGGGLDEAKKLKEESELLRQEMEQRMRAEIERLRGEVQKSAKDNESAVKTAKNLSEELARLRRLMRTSGSAEPSTAVPADNQPS